MSCKIVRQRQGWDNNPTRQSLSSFVLPPSHPDEYWTKDEKSSSDVMVHISPNRKTEICKLETGKLGIVTSANEHESLE